MQKEDGKRKTNLFPSYFNTFDKTFAVGKKRAEKRGIDFENFISIHTATYTYRCYLSNFCTLRKVFSQHPSAARERVVGRQTGRKVCLGTLSQNVLLLVKYVISFIINNQNIIGSFGWRANNVILNIPRPLEFQYLRRIFLLLFIRPTISRMARTRWSRMALPKNIFSL